MTVLSKKMHPRQMQDIVLKCPNCESYNAVISIPTLREFVGKLQQTPVASEKIDELQELFSEARRQRDTSEEVATRIEERVPEFNWLRDLLVPSDAGEFYALLTFLLTFLMWYQRRSGSHEPSTIVNNYFLDQDPFKDVGRNNVCPCGSGKKYKHCHG